MPPRIVTLTLNPAIDLACTADAVQHTHKVRTRDEHIDPGGGGINVARVLHAMDANVQALILSGGVTGALIEDLLNAAHVPHRTLRVRGSTRISFTVFDQTAGVEYRFVPEGPQAEPQDWHNTLAILSDIEMDWLVASGSLEHGMPENLYAQVARLARYRDVPFVLDTSGPPLLAALGYGIDLMKPSLSELETIAGHRLPDAAAQEAEALRLVHEEKARMVAVTLGEDGAFLASADGVARLPALPVEFRSAVGAGDSFVAAMTLRLAEGAAPLEALKWGMAAGAAAVVRAGTARVRMQDIEEQYRRWGG